MTRPEALSPLDLEKLVALDTCTVSNAIEQLDVRLRNEGFMSDAVRCQFPHFPSTVGYAVTGKIRTSTPPTAHRCYYDRMDWWTYVASLPEPRIMVLEDADVHPGMGAFVGEIHAEIGRALNCVGCITNGAVRDLRAVEAIGFQLFAGGVSVTHAYAHITEFGGPVEIGGLKIESGDLIHGDRHGVLKVPHEGAALIPALAAQILQSEHELIRYCRSPHFTLEGLGARIKNANLNCDSPRRAK